MTSFKNIHLMTRRFLFMFTLLLVLSFSFGSSYAQESILVGQDKVGEISATNPTPTYFFTATANQQVTIRVSAVASPVLPQFTILNAAGALVQAVGNPLGSSSIESVVNFAVAGNYGLQISSSNGSTGQFVVSILSTQPAVPPTPLAPGQEVNGNLASNANLVYSFTGDPNQYLLLDLSGLEGLNVEVELSTSTGEVLAKLSNRFLNTQLLLPSGGDSYLLKISNPLPTPVNYRLLLSLQAPSQETTLAELPTTGPCVLATQQATAVNVRAAPSTESAILNTILPTEIYTVIGRNTDSSWYQISYTGGSGWVAASVTRRGGDCRNVAITATLTPPTATGTAATGPTATGTATSTGPTATATVTSTGPTATATTASQAQIAEPDNDQSIEINIKSDNKTLTGVISFPQGDSQDAVSYRVVGFDSVTTAGNVNITAVCTGPGAENARVSFGGGGGGVPCNGASSTQFHTNDSNQGRVNVSVQAGEGAYVSWTLVFNASN